MKTENNAHLPNPFDALCEGRKSLGYFAHPADQKGPWQHTLCGRKWGTLVQSAYFSGGFEFDTFAQACQYVRDQYNHELAGEQRQGGDGRYCAAYFRAEIRGPGGTLDWDAIKTLITQYEKVTRIPGCTCRAEQLHFVGCDCGAEEALMRDCPEPEAIKTWDPKL